MRFSFPFILACCTSLTLAGCADENAANKVVKTSSLSGRQEVKLRLAHATEESGDFAGAEKLFIQVVAQAPGSIDANVELGDFYKRHHEDQKAIESLNTALKLDPRNTGIERSIANTYIGIAEPEKALAVLDQAIAINPKDPLLYNSKGVALDQIGSYSQAQNAYKMAYDLDTIGGTTYKVNISMSYILSGSYDKAIALLRPMLDTPDAPPIVRQNLALAYGMKGENDEALKLGLQDLSTSEAEENLRFYRMLAQKHLARMDKNSTASTAPVPASVVRELFPENEPEDVSAAPTPGGLPRGEAMPDMPKVISAAPVTPVEIVETTAPAQTPPKPTPAIPVKIVEEPVSVQVVPKTAPTNLIALNPSSNNRMDSDIKVESATTSVIPDESPLPEPVLKPDNY